MKPIILDRVEAFALSASPSTGPRSSLGPMPTRNGLLIALTTVDGVKGWGEIWCNFPPRGAAGRLALLQDVIAPALIGTRFRKWDTARPWLETKFHRMILHTGEPGPFAHCFAGIDTALADIAARQAALPLAQFLNPNAGKDVRTYASTPNPDRLSAAIEEIAAAGHTTVKLKIGYDPATDLDHLMQATDAAQGRLVFWTDANQNWSLENAVRATKILERHNIALLEEPLLASAPISDWAKLAEATSISIAAGENITSSQQFADMARSGGLRVLQPDVAKWGGISGALAVGRDAKEVDARTTAHFMGTGLGLAASSHVISAIDTDGSVELDANPNPLRTDLCPLDLTPRNGRLTLPTAPGIGVVPDMGALAALSTATIAVS